MEDLFTLDWRAVFVPQHSLLEMIVRGTIMYLAIFAMLRTVRAAGVLSVFALAGLVASLFRREHQGRESP